jgi:hypothetical protein
MLGYFLNFRPLRPMTRVSEWIASGTDVLLGTGPFHGVALQLELV